MNRSLFSITRYMNRVCFNVSGGTSVPKLPPSYPHPPPPSPPPHPRFDQEAKESIHVLIVNMFLNFHHIDLNFTQRVVTNLPIKLKDTFENREKPYQSYMSMLQICTCTRLYCAKFSRV